MTQNSELQRDIIDIVCDFAYGENAVPHGELFMEIAYYTAFHDCVPPAFMQAAFFDCDRFHCVPSPFRKNTAFVPLRRLRAHSVFIHEWIMRFVENVEFGFWGRCNTYAAIAKRRVRKLTGHPEPHKHWNMFCRYFARIGLQAPADFVGPIMTDFFNGLKSGEYGEMPTLAIPSQARFGGAI